MAATSYVPVTTLGLPMETRIFFGTLGAAAADEAIGAVVGGGAGVGSDGGVGSLGGALTLSATGWEAVLF